nr:capsid protein [Cressdnaviricota sp.]
MAFYGKYNRRRNYRSSRRRLSNRVVFGKTSAKSQAKQIATLRNRINRVYKKTRPEIKNILGAAIKHSFSSGVLSNVWYSGVFPMPVLNSGKDNGMIGNYCKPVSLQLNGTIEYYNNSNTGYHDSESAGCMARVIIVQRKTPEDYTTNHELSEFIPNPSNTGPEYTTMAVKPLRTGITENWNVLCDRRFILTSDKNQKIFRIRVKPRPFRFNNENNNIFNYCKFIVIAAGLHYDENFKEYLEFTEYVKMSYTDA